MRHGNAVFLPPLAGGTVLADLRRLAVRHGRIVSKYWRFLRGIDLCNGKKMSPINLIAGVALSSWQAWGLFFSSKLSEYFWHIVPHEPRWSDEEDGSSGFPGRMCRRCWRAELFMGSAQLRPWARQYTLRWEEAERLRAAREAT